MKGEKTVGTIVCNVCGKEIEGFEAQPISVVVGAEEYYNFHLCDKHWAPLCDQLSEIPSSTGR